MDPVKTMGKVIWVNVFKNGPIKFFKSCLLQILLGLFLNALTHLLEQFSSHFRRHTFIFNFPEAKLLVTNTKYLIRVPKTASTLLKSL